MKRAPLTAQHLPPPAGGQWPIVLSQRHPVSPFACLFPLDSPLDFRTGNVQRSLLNGRAQHRLALRCSLQDVRLRGEHPGAFLGPCFSPEHHLRSRYLRMDGGSLTAHFQPQLIRILCPQPLPDGLTEQKIKKVIKGPSRLSDTSIFICFLSEKFKNYTKNTSASATY